MASVNKVILIGNVGRDPELRNLPNGDAACSLSIATSRKWKDKGSGDMMEETEWHRVVAFGRTAEVAAQYLKKGSPVYIEGRLKTRKWTDKEGVEKYTTEIVSESMQFLGARGDDAEPPAQRQAPAPAPRPAARAPAPQKTGGGFDDFDSDIPF